MTRIDFSPKTKEIIAARSGYKCSFPDCNRTTIGPGAASDETANIGVASHIYAASPGGPRGVVGLTEDELSSPENGIWLCANHARLVDTNRGDKYPPALLHSYKALHEAQIAHENQGIKSLFGWFHEIRIEKSPIFSSHQIARLAKLTLIIGNNATGKTALCQWLAGLSDLRYITRWRKGQRSGYPINIFLKYYNPGEKILEMIIKETGHINFLDNGTVIPFNANPMKILYPLSRDDLDTEGLNDLQIIAALLNMDESVVINLCDDIQRYPQAIVKNLEFKQNEEGRVCLYLDMRGNYSGLGLSSLSSGERECVLIEFAAAAARLYAKHLPTLLILDGTVNNLHESWFEFYANHFNESSSLFQAIVVIPDRLQDVNKLKWVGWEIIRTKGRRPEITIEQSIRSSE